MGLRAAKVGMANIEHNPGADLGSLGGTETTRNWITRGCPNGAERLPLRVVSRLLAMRSIPPPGSSLSLRSASPRHHRVSPGWTGGWSQGLINSMISASGQHPGIRRASSSYLELTTSYLELTTELSPTQGTLSGQP